jgi:hypothetical protein
MLSTGLHFASESTLPLLSKQDLGPEPWPKGMSVLWKANGGALSSIASDVLHGKRQRTVAKKMRSKVSQRASKISTILAKPLSDRASRSIL